MEVVRTFQMERLLQANEDCISHPNKSVTIEIQTVTGEKENWFRWEITALSGKEKVVNGVRFLGTDITRQKKTEQALLQQAILLDNISDVIVSADENLSLRSWNLQAEMLFGLGYDRDTESCTHQIAAIEFVGDQESNFRRSLRESEYWNGEVVVIKTDGTRRHMQAMVNAVKDKLGRVSGYVAVGRDVTRENEMQSKLEREKKQSRQGLAKEKEQFHSFMENAPLLAWIIDEHGILRYMNSRFRDAFGYTAEQLNSKIGSKGRISEREKLLAPHQDVIQRQQCLELLHEWTDDQKKHHYYRTFKFPIQDVDGSWLEGGQSIEITSELAAERELRKSNELFDYASRATRDVIWDWDLKTDRIRRSSGYRTLFGYEQERTDEPNSFSRIHPDDHPAVQQTIRQALAGEDSRWYIEYRYLCRDGSYKNVIDQAYIVRNRAGKPVRAIGSMQDVTEERKLQRQILMAEKQNRKEVVDAVIAAQEKEREEISAELHDNVNQILAATILYLKAALKEPSSGPQMIGRSINYIQKAIEELRTISSSLATGNLQISGLLPALQALVRQLNIPNNFEVKLELGDLSEDAIPSALKLAVYRMVQEMMNNIFKHAHATSVRISLCRDALNLVLRVSDNGKGFDPATVKRGLGITNIQTRAENLNGIVHIHAAPGKGSTFEVLIPFS